MEPWIAGYDGRRMPTVRRVRVSLDWVQLNLGSFNANNSEKKLKMPLKCLSEAMACFA